MRDTWSSLSSNQAVEVAGIVVDLGGEWTKQIARNLIDSTDGFLRRATPSGAEIRSTKTSEESRRF